MKKVSAYVKGDRNSTAYYRIYQYLDEIKNIGVRYKVMYPKIVQNRFMPIGEKNLVIKFIVYIISVFRCFYYLLNDLIVSPDYIVVHKRIVSRYTPSVCFYIIEYLRRVKGTLLIWDFDDDLVEGKEITIDNFKLMSSMSDKIIVTHDYLKNKIEEKYRHKVSILPTTDGDMYDPNITNTLNIQRVNKLTNEIDLVWVGTSSNIKNLIPVLPALDKAAEIIEQRDGRKIVLKIVCDKPVFFKNEHIVIENTKWTRKLAIKNIRSAHIGIMPLLDTEYNKGKGGFKLVQYLSTALPCIGSDVGFNSSVINKECGFLVKNDIDWINSILVLSEKYKWEEYSINAFKQYEEKFSYSKNLYCWKKILK